MNDWVQTSVAAEGTHHVGGGTTPLYSERFDEVLKFHSPGLAPVRRGGQAWHIDVYGHAACAERHRRTFGFYDGRAAVVAETGWHHVLPDGTPLYEQRYAWCGNYQEARCPVRARDGHYFHIDHSGRAVYDTRWRYAGDYRDGIAVVQRDDGTSTHVDRAGTPLHERWFLDLDVFHKRIARARDEGGWAHIGLDGQALYAHRFAMVEPFYNGQARVERFDGALEGIDESGEAVLQLRSPQHRTPAAHA